MATDFNKGEFNSGPSSLVTGYDINVSPVAELWQVRDKLWGPMSCNQWPESLLQFASEVLFLSKAWTAVLHCCTPHQEIVQVTLAGLNDR
jgi:hypothetical protein